MDSHLQVWTKKGSSEKGRGQNSKLPPRFAKKQQQQAAAAAAQQAQAQAQAQAQSPCAAQTPGQPQASVQPQNQAAGGTAASTEYTVSGKVLQNTQAHNGLGTELWENKVPATAVLNDISKKCKYCSYWTLIVSSLLMSCSYLRKYFVQGVEESCPRCNTVT